MVLDRLLVTTDFTEHSRAAAALARDLVRDPAALRLLHVLPTPVPAPFLIGRDRESLQEASQSVRESAEAATRRVADELGLPADAARVAEGSVARTVAREAEDFDADAVVVGGRHHGTLERLLFGARGRAILREVHRHVLVGRGRGDAVRRVAVATDFGESSRRAAVLARELMDSVPALADAELLLVHTIDTALWGDVLTTPAGPQGNALGPHSLERMQRAVDENLAHVNAEDLGGRARVVRLDGNPAKRLVEFAKDEDVDLLVVGTHGPGALERTLVGSVAEHAAAEAACSVLVVKAEE